MLALASAASLDRPGLAWPDPVFEQALAIKTARPAAASRPGMPRRVDNAITPAAYRALGFPGADDLGNMFQFYSDFEQDLCDARSISETKSLNPELLTFDRWLVQNKSQIKVG